MNYFKPIFFLGYKHDRWKYNKFFASSLQNAEIAPARFFKKVYFIYVLKNNCSKLFKKYTEIFSLLIKDQFISVFRGYSGSQWK